jgi:hypothetical protein
MMTGTNPVGHAPWIYARHAYIYRRCFRPDINYLLQPNTQCRLSSSLVQPDTLAVCPLLNVPICTLLSGLTRAGAVIVALRKRFPAWPVAALIRNEAHHAAIRALGISVVHGSLADYTLIEEQAYEADIVVNAADADDFPATEAILRGLKRRHDAGRPKGTLVHTSGVAVFSDGKKEGKSYPDAKIYNVGLHFLLVCML